MCNTMTALYLIGAMSASDGLRGQGESQYIELKQTVIECDGFVAKVSVSKYMENSYRTIDNSEVEISFSYKIR